MSMSWVTTTSINKVIASFVRAEKDWRLLQLLIEVTNHWLYFFLFLNNLFIETAFITPCILGNNNEIKLTILLNISTIGILFINYSMTHCVCKKLYISLIKLLKPKPITKFDGKVAPNITYVIYFTFSVQNHKDTVASFLITKLSQHSIIFKTLWMEKHGVILDISYDKLIFCPGHCTYYKAP